MASKKEIILHNRAVDRVKNYWDTLSFEEQQEALETFHEGIGAAQQTAGAFFTPGQLCRDFILETFDGNIIDLCAGIGKLSYYWRHYGGFKGKITCVEINPDYVEIGKAILPDAEWICGSVVDEDLVKELVGRGKFDLAISNPPFGNVLSGKGGEWLKYQGSDFEFKVIEVASMLADHGTFILPQMSTPFRFSGRDYFSMETTAKLAKFAADFPYEMEFNCGIDTSFAKTMWKNTAVITEIVTYNFTQPKF